LSGIGRRVRAALRSYEEGDFEASATALFQAIDATGRKLFPKTGNAVRFKGMLERQEDLISVAALGSRVVGIVANGQTMPQVMWKFGRNPLLHEAELDPRISFSNANGFSAGEQWNFPPNYLVGLALGVISANVNSKESEKLSGTIIFLGSRLPIQSLWGSEVFLRKLVCQKFG